MGRVFPRLGGLELPEAQRRAIEVPLRGLRTALDGERYEAAVGAAKELVEAASKLVLARAGTEPAARASVASIAKLALATGSSDPSDEDLARRMGGVVEALGNLRMEVGTGHGRAEQDSVAAEVVRLAASAACAIARFILSRTCLIYPDDAVVDEDNERIWPDPIVCRQRSSGRFEDAWPGSDHGPRAATGRALDDACAWVLHEA